MVYNGYFFRWCPIYPKWDSYQPLCSDRTHIFSMTSLGCVIIYHGKKSDQLPTPNVGQQSVYPLVNVYETMERSTFFMGKSTISMAIFNSYVTNYQRVSWGLLRTINPEDHPMPSPVELCFALRHHEQRRSRPRPRRALASPDQLDQLPGASQNPPWCCSHGTCSEFSGWYPLVMSK